MVSLKKMMKVATPEGSGRKKNVGEDGGAEGGIILSEWR